MMEAEREMTLDEWCEEFGARHLARKELDELRAWAKELEANNQTLYKLADDVYRLRTALSDTQDWLVRYLDFLTHEPVDITKLEMLETLDSIIDKGRKALKPEPEKLPEETLGEYPCG